MADVINLREKQIRDFLNADKVDLKYCPDEAVRERFPRKHEIDLTGFKCEEAKQDYIDLLISIFCYDKPYKLDSKKSFCYALRLNDFLKKIDNSFTLIDDTDLKNIYYKYVEKCGYYKDCKKIIIPCKEAVLELRDDRKGFDRDYWDSSVFSLAPKRINKAKGQISLNFRKISNINNRELVKVFMKHLLGDTEMGLSTIANYISIIYQYCEFLKDINILDVTNKNFNDYMQSKESLSSDTFNKHIIRIQAMYKYFAVKDMLKNPVPIDETLFKEYKQEQIENSVSKHVILQIFNNLYKVSDEYKIMFLVNYTTGMRVSDVCQLRTDCLFFDGDDGYYLKHHNCQKMRKPLMNLIPKALYEIIEIQIQKINSLENEENWLIPSETDSAKPYLSATFRHNFKKLCKEWNIKNEDGSPYNYKTHSYRHAIANDLYQNYDVPLIVIQKAVLFHQEIQMSLSYVERPNEFKQMKENKYISKCGSAVLPREIKENIRAFVLPNGVCTMSDKLGVCPAVDACLSCPHFTTSVKFLDKHKEQLDTIKKALPIYEVNGWINNIVTAKRQIKELEGIIERLEREEDSNGSTEYSITI